MMVPMEEITFEPKAPSSVSAAPVHKTRRKVEALRKTVPIGQWVAFATMKDATSASSRCRTLRLEFPDIEFVPEGSEVLARRTGEPVCLACGQRLPEAS